MAGYRGHIAGGLAAALACTLAVSMLPYEQLSTYANLLQGWQTLAGVFMVAMLFALFPDVDIKSKGQSLFYWLVFTIDVLLIWNKQIQAAAYLGIIALLPLLSKHRGWTHSVGAAFVVPTPIIIIPYLYSERLLAISVLFYGAAVVGYLSHIALDGQLTNRLRRLL